jgi:integrase/recombinase XerD
LRLEDLWLEERILKVKGKGNRERPIPIGRRVRRLLWGYLNRFRPEPVVPTGAPVFLTADGRRLTARRIQAMMAKYGRKPGIRGVRCSPHTLRHCAAVRFLRNGGGRFQPATPVGAQVPGFSPAPW